jgi:hypothetical protein
MLVFLLSLFFLASSFAFTALSKEGGFLTAIHDGLFLVSAILGLFEGENRDLV